MLKVPHVPVRRRMQSIAVLTSGGDAPGMNAAIRSVVRFGISKGCKVYGVKKGYRGLIDGIIEPLVESSVANTIQRGGTILKTDRCEEFMSVAGRRKAAISLRENGIEGLVVIGGDGSFRGAHLLENENRIPTVGIPGTIDNDVARCDDTIGFDTAINTAIEAIDRIRDTASSHDRLFLIEVMGRNSGFIAAQVGIGGGAETIIVPEAQLSLAEITETIDRGVQRGKGSSIVVVAEGPKPGLSNRLSDQLAKKGYNPKVCILGHTQRGGSPTAHDRYLASTLGAAAVSYLLGGRSNCMIGVQDDQVVCVPFKQIHKKKKPFPKEVLELARRLAI